MPHKSNIHRTLVLGSTTARNILVTITVWLGCPKEEPKSFVLERTQPSSHISKHGLPATNSQQHMRLKRTFKIDRVKKSGSHRYGLISTLL